MFAYSLPSFLFSANTAESSRELNLLVNLILSFETDPDFFASEFSTFLELLLLDLKVERFTNSGSLAEGDCIASSSSGTFEKICYQLYIINPLILLLKVELFFFLNKIKKCINFDSSMTNLENIWKNQRFNHLDPCTSFL